MHAAGAATDLNLGRQDNVGVAMVAQAEEALEALRRQVAEFQDVQVGRLVA